ncbi:hypothetical protein NAEGRDRAFT_67854 [Naegleria gruberi]|uniref:Cilia- and flagella-associated protein 45 n=1 Tax=Naegleria gruberi TaxID=5762 RepID=D2VG51_NAEGR|nr:uncharacterized protein NAEGRDRAFT_67854 [Naegleria gruberi]EFC44289.1 hypothetical protein NAEGRDRAFT_67854 [Naegleria gruberi]|eukprot:XP_002677033.1 hypothetical protein NAEGRDRAFT_67854 [Naegleria gruberi strain NEG-M]
MPSSNASISSAGSHARSTYRKVADTATVDENLFGTNKSSARGQPQQKQQQNNSMKMDKRTLQTVKKQPDAVVISASEFMTLKEKATPLEKQREAERKKREETLEAMERKERIRQLDREKKSKGDMKKSDLDVENEEKQLQLLEKAITQMDENIDEVKRMNSMALYSQCVTIRDKQLEEKQRIIYEKQEEDRRLDELMELERLKAIKMYEQREKKRQEDRRNGSLVIKEQMKEREKERLRELELKRQEQDAMLYHMQKMKSEDIKEAEEKKKQEKLLMEEIALANAEQISLKRRLKLAELEEDRQIADYLAEKERREQEITDQQERLRAEKEREVARLRALQEKAQDKLSEMDTLRAKRAQEALEREFRKKKMQEEEKRVKMNQELHGTRQKQKMEKENKIAELAREDREDFSRIVDHQKKLEELEKLKAEEEKKRRVQTQQQLMQQMDNTKEEKDKQRREYLEEGELLKRKMELERKKVELIRKKKLHELLESGIQDKYTGKLMTTDFTVEKLRSAAQDIPLSKAAGAPAKK